MNNYDQKYGYTKESFEFLYDDIFSELIDLECEFESFYSKEYENFREFLFKKFNMTKNDIEELIKFKNGSSNRRIFISVNSYKHQLGLQAIILSRSIKDEIIKLLT